MNILRKIDEMLMFGLDGRPPELPSPLHFTILADYQPALDGNGWIGVARDGAIFRLEPNGIVTKLTAPRRSAVIFEDPERPESADHLRSAVRHDLGARRWFDADGK